MNFMSIQVVPNVYALILEYLSLVNLFLILFVFSTFGRTQASIAAICRNLLAMLGFDAGTCVVSLRNRRSAQNNIKIDRALVLLVQNSFFHWFFSAFIPNIGYGNQRRLFSGNLQGMYFLKLFFKTSNSRPQLISRLLLRSYFSCR